MARALADPSALFGWQPRERDTRPPNPGHWRTHLIRKRVFDPRDAKSRSSPLRHSWHPRPVGPRDPRPETPAFARRRVRDRPPRERFVTRFHAARGLLAAITWEPEIRHGQVGSVRRTLGSATPARCRTRRRSRRPEACGGRWPSGRFRVSIGLIADARFARRESSSQARPVGPWWFSWPSGTGIARTA